MVPRPLAEKMHVIVMHAVGCTALFSQIAAVEAVRGCSALVAKNLEIYRERRRTCSDKAVMILNSLLHSSS